MPYAFGDRWSQVPPTSATQHWSNFKNSVLVSSGFSMHNVCSSSAFVSWKVKKKQMLMWFLAKLRPFLNASQEIEADRRRVSGFPSMIIENSYSKIKDIGHSKTLHWDRMTLKSATKIAVVKLIQFVFKARHASQEIGRDRRGSQVGLSMKCGKSAFSELEFLNWEY